MRTEYIRVPPDSHFYSQSCPKNSALWIVLCSLCPRKLRAMRGILGEKASKIPRYGNIFQCKTLLKF